MAMDSSENGEEPVSARHITDIPEEVLEIVFCHLSPYADLKNVMLVCKQWHSVASDLIVKLHRNFQQMLRAGNMHWDHVSNDQAMSITDRHSHSACYFEQSMYVFGGCSATSTTFNDLWRFDLTTRQWVRPLAMGTYPSPKACATMVPYKDSLILYGGWSRPTPIPLHQAPRFFSELHMYTPSTNRWAQITAVSDDAVHRLAGHSASILGNTMVVFGGSHDPGSGCNDVWMFDLTKTAWITPTITGRKPNPRYGQFQKTLDDEHILVVGGCRGPNQTFTDAWLLRLVGEEGSWEEITIANPEFCPAQMWCHPACMVDDLLVCISKDSRVRGSNPEPPNLVLQQNRVWVPPIIPPPGQPPFQMAQQNHHPHVPPPPPVPAMAAFQRRRENWGGGFGPPADAGPPNPGPHAHADNPNIQDVQRLRAQAQARPQAGGAGLRPSRGVVSAPASPQLHAAALNAGLANNSHNLSQPSSLHNAGLALNSVDRNDGTVNRTSNQDLAQSRAEPQAGPSGMDLSSSPSQGACCSSTANGQTFNSPLSLSRNGSSHSLGDGNVRADSSNSESPRASSWRAPSSDPNSPRLGFRAGSSSSLGAHNMSSTDSDSDCDGGVLENGGGGACAPRPGLPSVRPNAMHDRQRQLDMLRKHEDLLRSRNNSNQVGGQGSAVVMPRNPMVIHVLDTSSVLSDRTATWLPIRETYVPGAPEETIFYSLVEGRGELVMFGGIQHNVNPMQRAVNSPPQPTAHYVSNGLYLISPRQLLDMHGALTKRFGCG